MTQTEDPYPRSSHVPRQRIWPLGRPAAGASVALCGAEAADRHEYQPNCRIGHGVSECLGRVTHADTQPTCRVNVDRLVAVWPMNDRTQIGQCLHQFCVDGRLAGVDNRSDRRPILDEEILTSRLDRQHQNVVLRGQRRGERRRNFTYLQNSRSHHRIIAEAALAVTSCSNNSVTPNMWRRTLRRSGSDVPPLSWITVAPASGSPGPGSWAAEGGEAVTNIIPDLAIGLEIPMLDHRTPAHFEVQNRSLVLRCQALSGESHTLELLAVEIPALEVRIVAGIDHHRHVPDPARGVQTCIA